MLDLNCFKLVDTQGRPIPAGRLRLLEQLAGSDDPTKLAFRLADEDGPLLLKVRPIAQLKKRLQATLGGRSSLLREAANLNMAARAGLAVPAVVGRGVRRRMGLVVDQALLIQWLPDRTRLTDRLWEAHQHGDRVAVQACQDVLLELLCRIREAGFADKDFGVHNILMPADAKAAGDPVWVDLERAFRAAPDDEQGVCATCGAALSSWWVGTGGDGPSYQSTFDRMQSRLTPPRCGWSALATRMDAYIAKRLQIHLAAGRIRSLPNPLHAGRDVHPSGQT